MKKIIFAILSMCFCLPIYGQIVTDSLDYEVVEGDILIPKTNPNQVETVTERCNLWTNHRVPYIFNSNVSIGNQILMREAMNSIEAISDVRFIVRSSETDYIRINASETANSSYVGKQGGGQVINITSWTSKMTICHELFHCLGLHHEQSRPDRDNFVQINLNNVCQENRFNFDRITNAGRYGPYDFESIMHYSETAFSCTGEPTIQVRPGFESFTIGHLGKFSRMDILKIRFLYAPNNYRFFDINRAFIHNCNNWALSSFGNPINGFNAAIVSNSVPEAGQVIIQPGIYATTKGIYNRRMTLNAPLGGVTLR